MDGIGLDNCALPFTGPAPSTDHSVVEYSRFRDAWLKVNRPINLQIWDGGFGKPGSWAPGMGHLWRSGPDLGNRWDYDHKAMGPGSVMLNFDLQQVSRRFPLTPLQNCCLFIPELQWQSRGTVAYLTGVRTGNAWVRRFQTLQH